MVYVFIKTPSSFARGASERRVGHISWFFQPLPSSARPTYHILCLSTSPARLSSSRTITYADVFDSSFPRRLFLCLVTSSASTINFSPTMDILRLAWIDHANIFCTPLVYGYVPSTAQTRKLEESHIYRLTSRDFSEIQFRPWINLSRQSPHAVMPPNPGDRYQIECFLKITHPPRPPINNRNNTLARHRTADLEHKSVVDARETLCSTIISSERQPDRSEQRVR